MQSGWQDFWRDLKNGELTLLLLALILAVAATTTLRHFSSGIEKGLAQEAARLIGADLVLRSSRPLADDVSVQATRLGLASAHTLEFASVLQGPAEFQLAAVKAVSPGYPLRGQLRLRENNKDITTHSIPAKGTLWVDERLLGLLQAGVGDTVVLGEKSFRIAAILAFEPDRGGNFAAFSPRAMMALDDVAATGVIQPGSRLQYQLLMRGDEQALATFRQWITPRLGPGSRLMDVAGGRPELATPLVRASDYLSLAAIAAVVLAGLAIAVSARRFAERRYDMQALLRCLGASRGEAFSRVFAELLLVWAVAIILGALLGGLASVAVNHLLKDLLPVGAPAFTFWRPLLTGIATATLTLAGFALPALLSLGRVTPLRVLRRELLPPSLPQLAITALLLLALFMLLAMETGRLLLTALAVGGGAALVFLLQWALQRLLVASRRWSNPYLSVLRRHPAETATQILGLALGLTALLMVFSLRGELLGAWENKIPPGAPNQFALNISDQELSDFRSALHAQGFAHEALYPVVRGRLTAINGKPVQQAVSKEDGDGRDESLNRELNLTWSKTLPKGNRLAQGDWWSNDSVSNQEVSLETRLAERLGLKLGDRLTFTLAEGEFSAVVSSLREVDWDSFQPNFYMVFPPGMIDRFPASYMTSFNVPTDQRPRLNALVKAFPTVVLIDIASVMAEVKKLLEQVSRAVEAVLLFVLMAGVLVISAHVMASLDTRRHEAALLRVIGASRRELQIRLMTEFVLLGLIAGILAVVMSELLAAVVYWKVLELSPTLHPMIWWQAPLAGALLVGFAGMFGARRVWNASPLLTLRQE